MAYTEQAVCIYEIWDQTDGFRKWGPQATKIIFEEITGIKIIVAAGEEFVKAEVLFSTEAGTITLNSTLSFEIHDYVYVAIIPLSETNSLIMRYVEEDESNTSDGLTEAQDNFLLTLQVWITVGGISLAAFFMTIVCFIRRFQRWRDLQKIVYTDEEDVPSTPTKR